MGNFKLHLIFNNLSTNKPGIDVSFKCYGCVQEF